MRFLLPASVLGALALASCAPLPAQRSAADSRLVVLVAVDQLTPAYFTRFGSQYRGGFKRLVEGGAFYPRGEQDHAITETAPGHSTMLSGRSPASTGIATNIRGVSDPASPLLGSAGPGASPYRFRGTALYDWMLARDPGTRVLSVSTKDRGAILPVGRSRGPVFWYSDGRYTTSRYYRDTLPSWVEAFNGRGGAYTMLGRAWLPLLDEAAYAEPDSQPWERGGIGYLFPHAISADSSALARQLPGLPWMDSLTLAFALEGVQQEGLGQRNGPDLLVVSLSATDYIGHAYGPDSKEAHDHQLRLDLWLGAFLDSLAILVPADRTVLALTSDHGVTSYPEAAIARGDPGGRTSLGALAGAAASHYFDLFRTDFEFGFDNGLLSADVDALRARGVNVDSLAEAMATEARGLEGVAQVFTPRSLATSRDPGAARWRKLIPPDLGWLVAGVAKPGYIWILARGVAMHGTTNPSDVLVPILFYGPGIPAGVYSRTIRTVDIGPTLAALVGVRPTEKVEGEVLREVVGHSPP